MWRRFLNMNDIDVYENVIYGTSADHHSIRTPDLPDLQRSLPV